ncbi:MAG TPA: hypothetical protein VK969_11350 [Acidimicrobiia bacterium]|nr:hypothetical protein [Acidimicrobiia bacterium]
MSTEGMGTPMSSRWCRASTRIRSSSRNGVRGCSASFRELFAVLAAAVDTAVTAEKEALDALKAALG